MAEAMWLVLQLILMGIVGARCPNQGLKLGRECEAFVVVSLVVEETEKSI